MGDLVWHQFCHVWESRHVYHGVILLEKKMNTSEWVYNKPSKWEDENLDIRTVALLTFQIYDFFFIISKAKDYEKNNYFSYSIRKNLDERIEC